MVTAHWFSLEWLFGPPRVAGRHAALVAALSIATGTSFAQDDPAAAPAGAEREMPIVPVHHEPHHRQVFQYGPTRILELQVPPDDRSWFHTHEWPVLYMTLGTSAVRTETLGEDPAGRGGARAGGAGPGARAGGAGPAGLRGGAPGGRGDAPQRPAGPRAPRATSTTSYIETPVTHRIENIGDGLFRAMVVINETAGDDSISAEAAGFETEPELTNPWFRSYRVTLEPGESTATHRHHTPVVIFQAIDGTGRANGPMSFEFNEPGQWAFYDTDVEHVIRNTGTEAMQLLEIEVRLAGQKP